MKVALVTAFWCAVLTATAQTGVITGKVTDNRKVALPFASVYINQTTIGTTTADDGTFLLRGVPEGEQDLVVSYVGFQTFQTSVSVDDSVAVQIAIQLLPSTTAMKEIQIRAKKDKQWEQNFEKFQRLFFGNNGASLCRILNPWVLEFEEAGGRLIANADEAMEIENMNLGYRLSYLLKAFEVSTTDFKIAGLVRFTELQAADKELKDLWASRRMQAYLGSTRHFLKSVVEHRDMQEGFQLFVDVTRSLDIVRNQTFSLNVNEAIYPYNMIGKVLPGFYDGRYTVRFPPRLEVHYRRKVATPTVYSNVSWPVSWLEVDGGTLYINRQGVPLNATRLTTLGAMSQMRVAEILPNDYEPRAQEKKETRKSDSVATAPALALSGLLEKPYLHLDKPYYYHSDMVYFKAYMNYARPIIKDTLSRVIYVDLLTSDGRTLASRTLPLVNGMAAGDFFIGPDVPEGDLQIRAYTRWMLNFGNEIVFQKPLKVISDSQLGRYTEHDPPPPKGINLTVDKDLYGNREKVTMLIEAVDALHAPVVSNLSVSVTDVEQAVPPANEATIVNAFPFSERDARASASQKNTYQIQYGIPFKGKLIGKKKSQLTGEVRLARSSEDIPLSIATNEKGEFNQELQLMDSSELYLDAVTTRGKPATAQIDSTMIPHPEFASVPPLNVEFYIPSDPSKGHIPDELANARMLKTVTVSESRIKPSKEKPLSVDVVVDKTWLRSTLAIDLLSALQRRVPGLRVVYKMSAGGEPVKYIVFSGNFNLGGGTPQEPLVVLDGVPIQADEGSMAEKLSQLMVVDIENVEVLKFGNASLYGARSANGVIMVTTNRGQGQAGTTQKRDMGNMKLIKLRGYSLVTPFESPDYTLRKDDDADVRSTIYWNPNVSTTGKEAAVLSFYTADLSGTYRIVVEGLTIDGAPVRAEKFIHIKGN